MSFKRLIWVSYFPEIHIECSKLKALTSSKIQAILSFTLFQAPKGCGKKEK